MGGRETKEEPGERVWVEVSFCGIKEDLVLKALPSISGCISSHADAKMPGHKIYVHKGLSERWWDKGERQGGGVGVGFSLNLHF